MVKHLRRFGYLTFYAILLCIGVSLGWMTSLNPDPSDKIILEYGEDKSATLKVVDVNVDVDVQIEQNGEYVSTKSSATLMELNKLVPNDPIYVKLIFANMTNDARYVKIKFANMRTDSPIIFNVLYFSVVDSSGYPQYSTNKPSGTFQKISDTLQDDGGCYSFTAIERLHLPVATQENPQIEVLCYFYLERTADVETYGNVSLAINSLKVKF